MKEKLDSLSVSSPAMRVLGDISQPVCRAVLNVNEKDKLGKRHRPKVVVVNDNNEVTNEQADQNVIEFTDQNPKETVPQSDIHSEWVKVESRKCSRKGDVKSAKLSKKAAIAALLLRELILGSGTARVNLVRPRMKSLFVTQFDPSANVSDIEGLLRESSATGSVRCTKLVTKKEGYSSFHVEVSFEDYEKVTAPEVWPRGILVLPFFGHLKPEQIFKEEHDG